MTLKFIVAASLLWGTVGGFVALADRRAKYWKPIIEGIASRAETGPVTSLRVLPFKGCGWSIGETIYADMMLGNVRGAFLMCRNSQGVRVDITTYESRWMRGPAQAIDARRAETGNTGSVHESAVGTADAPDHAPETRP